MIEDNHIGDGSGGGIALFAAGTPTISGNVIVNNTTDLQGGGLHFANISDASVVQNIIAGNAAGWGGGIYWLVPSGARGPRLVNNTIVGNLSPNGSAVFADGFDVSTVLYNNLIIASLGQTALFCGNFNDTNPPILRSNDVYSAEGAAYGGICSDQTGNNGNLSVDPMLRDPAGGDLHPVAGSAVVDSGDNSAPDLPDEDLDGNDRVVDGDGDGTAVVDLGAFEAGPVIPETYLVNTTGDDDGTCDESPCSLREAINAANSHPGADTIAFGIAGDPPFTIQPEFALPNITDPVTIDGTTQKGWTIGAPVVELSGVKTPADVSGLLIEAGLSVVRGLIVNGYRGGGIMLIRNGGNALEGNFIGTNSEGTEAVGNSVGVWVGDHTTGNTIGGVTAKARNIISGNNGDGVSINESTSGTVVEGNYIGTDASGLAPLPNTSNGVVLVMGTTDNVIGGAQDGAGNVISANTGSGVDIADEGTSRNVVEGNFIGTDATGGLPLGNGGAGIDVRNGASGNTVGGAAEGTRNVISGNAGDGVSVYDAATTGNFVLGNYIGTDAGGTLDLGNGQNGVFLGGGASGNLVGGTDGGARNIISGNSGNGVAIFNPGTTDNKVQGNYIGTDVTGKVALGNNAPGIGIGDQASGNLIGGSGGGARNVISANFADGVDIFGYGTTGNRLEGNYIGTDVTGTAVLANGGSGIGVSAQASDNLIGGTESGEGNLISGNLGEGIRIGDTGTTGNVVQGNFIGTDVTGTSTTGASDPPAVDFDVTVEWTCPTYDAGTDIGGFISESKNPLDPWSGQSVHFQGQDLGDPNGCHATEVFGEASLIYRYKLDFGVVTPLTSIAVSGAAFNGPDSILRVLDENGEIAKSSTFGGNSFLTNYVTLQGVEGQTFYIEEYDTSGSWRYRQNIAVNGPAPLGNRGPGVSICCGASGNTVGWDSDGARNIISGNGGQGVIISEPGTDRNTIQSNFIGTDVTGTMPLGNSQHGVLIWGGPAENLIGGTEPGTGNLVSGNMIGVNISDGHRNLVLGNRIGTDVSGMVPQGNRDFGVVVDGGSTGNVIGGTGPSDGNVISGNASNGIWISGQGTSGNRVQGNLIGTNVTGMGQVGNAGSGVAIVDQASDNLIGGTGPGEGNLVSANGSDGISISNSSNGNMVQGNLIGTNLDGSEAMGNACGIWIGEGAANTIVGGTEDGARNVISGNIYDGISINGPASGTVVQGNLIGTDPSGASSVPNQGNGVSLVSGTYGNSIGGTALGAGNIISSNMGDGVAIVGPETHGNVVQGNRIGTDLTGIAPLPNASNGVILWEGADDNLIGGSEEGAGNLVAANAAGGVGVGNSPENVVAQNVIHGNTGAGVWIWGAGSIGNKVQGNLIGTDPEGAEGLGNGYGVWIGNGAANNMIGGTEPGDGNTIAFNATQGVAAALDAGAGNAILANATHDNGELGIDLGEDGVTANDPRDRDSGPNDLQNFPVLSPPILFHGSLKVAGILWSKPNSTYRLEFFEVTTCDPSGYGEGNRYLGSTRVRTGPLGFAAFVFQLPRGFESRALMTATATDSAGSTSEFSHCSGPARHVGGGR